VRPNGKSEKGASQGAGSRSRSVLAALWASLDGAGLSQLADPENELGIRRELRGISTGIASVSLPNGFL